MVNKLAFAKVKGSQLVHFFFCQAEIKQIEVFPHPLVGRLWNDYHAGLDQKAKVYLRGCLTVLLTDFHQRLIGKQIIFPLSQRRPCHELNTVLFQNLTGNLLLLEDVNLKLVDRRYNIYKTRNINESVRHKIADSDGPNLTSPTGFFHRPIRAVIIVEGLMDEHKIHIIGFLLPKGIKLLKPQSVKRKSLFSYNVAVTFLCYFIDLPNS